MEQNQTTVLTDNLTISSTVGARQPPQFLLVSTFKSSELAAVPQKFNEKGIGNPTGNKNQLRNITSTLMTVQMNYRVQLCFLCR